MTRKASPVIFTIGHSTRPIPEFLELLRLRGIRLLADIRTVPRSGYNPQYNNDRLRAALALADVAYVHIPELGGLRKPAKDSKNTGWRNASFRGYADHMAAPEFRRGLTRLTGLARRKRTAIMCAEAVPWRCHRSLVADALTVKKWKVYHVTGKSRPALHKRTSFLRVRKGELVYPKIDISK